MSEGNFDRLTPEDFPEVQPVVEKPIKKLSRRQVLKNAAYKAMSATSVVGVGAFTIRGVAEVAKTAAENHQDPFSTMKDDVLNVLDEVNLLNTDIHHEQDDLFLKNIENRLGIQLITLPEAYKALGKKFDPGNTAEFGNLLPMRWDHERAAMVETFFPSLPEFFREKDGHGNRLMMTLTNFGDNCSCAGEYHPTDNLIKLDFDNFQPGDQRQAFELLTHESVHRMQDMGYSRLDEYIKKIFHRDVKKFCTETVAWLDTQKATTPDEQFVFDNLRYGVQDLLGIKERNAPRDKTNELESSLAELYVHGNDFFVNGLTTAFGQKNAQALYEYLRDYIFGGKEYEKFPIETAKQDGYEKPSAKDEPQLAQGAEFFNNLTLRRLTSSAREASLIPLFDPTGQEIKDSYEDYRFYVWYYPLQNELSTFNCRWEKDDVTYPVLTNKTTDQKGNLVSDYLQLSVSQDGTLLRTDSQYHPLPKDELEDTARRTFRMPKEGVSWATTDLENQGYFTQGTWIKGDDRHSIVVWENGKLSYKVDYHHQSHG